MILLKWVILITHRTVMIVVFEPVLGFDVTPLLAAIMHEKRELALED